MPDFRLCGIVLAAGRSTRMGRPKALLHTASGETFVSQITDTLKRAGVAEVLVVGRPDDGALRRAVGDLDPIIRYVENPDPERGQLSSLLAGLDAAESRAPAGVLVLPVDTPMVRADTVAAAIAAFRTTGSAIVRVSYQGRHGHPVIFGAGVFGDLRTADPAVGAKAVLRSLSDRVFEIEVDDRGVLADVDEPADYRRLFGRDPE